MQTTFTLWPACGTTYVRANGAVIGTVTTEPVPGSQRRRHTVTFSPRQGVADRCGLRQVQGSHVAEVLALLALDWAPPMTRDRAQEAFRVLVRKYGLAWSIDTPVEAHTSNDLIGTVLDEAGRREALGLPA